MVVQLPRRALIGDASDRYRWELESLAPIADLVEVKATSREDFIAGARDADAIITSWGFRITREVIERLDRCVVIGVGSVGVDKVDVDAATDAGIVVTNVPDVFIEEVADHTMMLLLACARRLKKVDQFVTDGNWRKGRHLLQQVPRLWGQTLGLISFGNVARAVARRAKPFGLHVIAYDPYVAELKMTGEGVEPVSFGELLERSDFVSVHPGHNDETYHMLSTSQFEAMKPTAMLINCGRGATVDEAALIDALKRREIAGAGLDVLEKEPPRPKSPLLQMPNVILTSHVASATTRMRPEARRRVGRDVAMVLRGKWPMSCVNPAVLPKTPLERWQPIPMERGPNR
ncbi:MAG: C-terminal binding protein [Gemmatimonadetes bacterium]|nr:C-terminal binding protein [Gemmatimonadota bacterium]MCK5482561.1 C-terminal binding protein [Gemmatimonadota bacterium]